MGRLPRGIPTPNEWLARVVDERGISRRGLAGMIGVEATRVQRWISGRESIPRHHLAEIARQIGYRTVVLDIEHGTFDLADLERFIPTLKGLGYEVYAKVLGPFREAIQQALDFGADAVIVPHIEGAAHAKLICGFAKFPPLGDRSSAGERGG